MSGGIPNAAVPYDDFADGVVPPEMEDTGKIVRKLEAWHKPRKQLVRRGWRDNVRRLMGELKLPVGAERVFRYFTLPAPEMLDVRTLEQAAREKEFKVQFVGFTNARSGSDDDRQLQLGQTMLRAQADWVHSASSILHYRLEELVEGDRPVARTRLKDYGPFHVINLDLCDYLLAPGPHAKLLDALSRILEMQTTRHSDDWLLFIATRFDADSTCPEKFERIREAITSNCAVSNEFKTGLEALLKIGVGTHDEILSNPAQLSQDHLRDTISVGLTKWLASLLLKANPPFELEMMRTYVYAVDGSKHDMLSLVYRCRYKGTPAPAATSAEEAATAEATREVLLGLRALDKTRKLVDLDAELRGDDAIRQELADETKALLKQANYSDDVLGDYEAWAEIEAVKAEGGG
ncbi:MAG: hypothetical protein JF606_10020 [Burkholderiales bacterium]|jgi:hypothetical protein|nr:hypothetical protein [Burkholderiales bacterium]